MKLTQEQLAVIQKIFEGNAIRIQTLREDLMDHICSSVEYKMEKGSAFEVALSTSLDELAPDGLKEIERETLFLLHSDKVNVMKKLVYIIGFFGAVALTAGVTFKLLHLPGADQLFIIGFLSLLLVFVPMSAVQRYRANANTLPEKLKMILGVTAAITAGLAGVFKIMHLPGADFLLLSGAGLFALGFLPFLFFTLYKKSVSS